MYLYLLLFTLVNSQELVTRQTTYGTLQGYTIPLNTGADQRLDAFIGVPYAKPPLGALRWSAPEYPDTWTGIRNATSHGPCCIQDLDIIRDWYFGPDYNNTDEDCLYLNLHAPRNLSNPGQIYPVFVWIHGGSFVSGSSEEFDGRVFAQNGNVIVVSVNYRLGALGFLSTDDDAAQGNYGLMDIVHALHWIQDNVAVFGGDPSRVTIAGDSAGAAAVSELMFVPDANGLFAGVASFSGDALADWALYRPPASMKPHTEMLAQNMSCPTTDTQAMVDCLRTKDAMEIVTVVSEEIGVGVNPFNLVFSPRVDGTFIPDLPENMLRSGDFNQVNLLSGTSANESASFLSDLPEEGFSRIRKEAYMRGLSIYLYDEQSDMVFPAVSHEYNEPRDIWTEQRDLFLNMLTDLGFKAPHTKHSRRHSDFVTDTYVVTLDHRSENHPTPDYFGVPHAEEICYIAGCMFWDTLPCPWGCNNVEYPSYINWTAMDSQVSLNMMDTWSAFVTVGEPSTPYYQWPRFNRTTELSASIKDDAWIVREFDRFSEMTFWNDMMPGLLNNTPGGPVDRLADHIMNL